MTTQLIGGNPQLIVPRIIMGCMRINSLSENELNELISTAIDNGVNYFDHADI